MKRWMNNSGESLFSKHSEKVSHSPLKETLLPWNPWNHESLAPLFSAVTEEQSGGYSSVCLSPRSLGLCWELKLWLSFPTWLLGYIHVASLRETGYFCPHLLSSLSWSQWGMQKWVKIFRIILIASKNRLRLLLRWIQNSLDQQSFIKQWQEEVRKRSMRKI
jgi:hypothetical protein